MFSGSGQDPDGDTPLSYHWDFAGGAVNSIQQNPGNVKFLTPGVYRVQLTVSDAKGLADPTPAEVVVTVRAVTANNLPPNSVIDSPAVNMTILRGQSINFRGSGSDPDSNTPLTYLWDFNGGAPNSTQQNPGDVRFDQAGFFTVTLTVKDALGLADPTPAVVYVSVLDNNLNQAPNASILSPAADMTISVGDTVLFAGSATDPEGNTPLSYLWNFDGAAPNTTAQNPGLVRFDVPGVYRVQLTAKDSLGAVDRSPAVRIITVTSTTSITPPDSQILQPASSVTIAVGDSVDFSGQAVAAANSGPFTYLWNFDGAAPNATVAAPGAVTFHNEGIYNVSFRVTDANGISDPTPATVQIVVQNTLALNEPPNGVIVSPVTDMVIYEGDSLNFTAVGYDPDGDTMSFLWSFDGGAPDKFVKDPGVVQFKKAGVYQVTMTVSDSAGLTDPTPDSVTITVKAVVAPDTASPPNALIAQPSADMAIAVGDTVNFTGLVLDSDNNVTSYLWNFDGAVPNSTRLNPGDVTFNQAGTYRVRFNATDATGLSDPTPDEVVITVSDINTPSGNIAPNGIIDSPASDMTITVGEAVNFRASAVDPDNNTPISYRWNFDGAIPNSTAQNPGWVTFNRVGMYRIVLTVTDSAGVSDATPAERIITVQGVASGNTPPDGTIKSPVADKVINVGDSVFFAGGGTDAESNYPLVYYWDFAGAMPNYIGATPGTVVFKQAGVYDIQLKVIDSLGLMDPTPATVRITVGAVNANNQPPESTIDYPLGDITITAGDSVAFRGSGVDPEGGAVSFHWSFGSNSIAQQSVANPVVTFDTAGSYLVSFTAIDNLGLRDPTPATLTVTVLPANSTLGNEPNGTIISPAGNPVYINKGDSLTFDAQVNDPNGDNSFFIVWNFGTYPIPNQVGKQVRVTFNEIGTATVTLRVRDSTNLWDPTPASVDVIVR